MSYGKHADITHDVEKRNMHIENKTNAFYYTFVNLTAALGNVFRRVDYIYWNESVIFYST